MKKLLLMAIGIVSLSSFILIESIRDRKAVPAAGFAVVELYTSEGCSSCPPADELISQIQKENIDKPVYILAFHVDYWNRLGWKDIFSKHEYSERQNTYAGWFNSNQVYTPQVIVNGRSEFVGSDESSLRRTIKAALTGGDHGSPITLSEISRNGNKVDLNYQIGSQKPGRLVLALVQKNTVSHIKSGENRGRTLSHVQLVRGLQTISTSTGKQGHATLETPDDKTGKDFEIIAFLQNIGDGAIYGANKAAIPPFNN